MAQRPLASGAPQRLGKLGNAGCLMTNEHFSKQVCRTELAPLLSPRSVEADGAGIDRSRQAHRAIDFRGRLTSRMRCAYMDHDAVWSPVALCAIAPFFKGG